MFIVTNAGIVTTSFSSLRINQRLCTEQRSEFYFWFRFDALAFSSSWRLKTFSYFFDSVRNSSDFSSFFFFTLGQSYSWPLLCSWGNVFSSFFWITSLCIHTHFNIYDRKTRNDILFFIEPYLCRQCNPSHSCSHSTLYTQTCDYIFSPTTKYGKNYEFFRMKNLWKKSAEAIPRGNSTIQIVCVCLFCRTKPFIQIFDLESFVWCYRYSCLIISMAQNLGGSEKWNKSSVLMKHCFLSNQLQIVYFK